MSRRSALALGGRLAGGLLLATSLGSSANAAAPPFRLVSESDDFTKDIKKSIEEIIQAQGKVSSGVFTIAVDRDDISDVTLHGVPITPSFQINGALNFQKVDGGRVFMNSDMALKGSEIDPFIDQLLRHDIVFQAEHQHFYDFSPLVWFIHFRAAGAPQAIARGVKAALNVTSTPFPQTSPQNPTTPLPAEQLGDILGGSVSVGAGGVVTVDVPREDAIILGGHRINPYLNVQTSTVFQPYGGGQNAAAAPDFGMSASEIQSVIGVMRGQGWDIGCLYNQETDEQPQLFFSHNFKTGNAVELAREIRKGLDRMDMKFKS